MSFFKSFSKNQLKNIGFLLVYGFPMAVFAHGSITPLLFAGEKIPESPGLISGKSPIVVDQNAAIELGKALFWDMNVGSNGVACASCHFHAGADARTRNQLAPGIFHLSDTKSSKTFEIGNANYELKKSDFPFFRFSNNADKYSELLFSTDDVVGSAGTFSQTFVSLNFDGDTEQCTSTKDKIFNNKNLNARQVTNRNAPTVINAAFNYRNFWDGRANNIFNGQSAFGKRDTKATVWMVKDGTSAVKTRLNLENASLASQAVAPPLDMIEMSCKGKTFEELGRKLLPKRPLESQQIHPEDSVLSTQRHSSGYGLNTTYEALIKQAFSDKYWAGKANFGTSRSGTPYSQTEANFALFFGLAIQLYEDTLVSDQAPIDSPLDAKTGFPSAYNEQEISGATIFLDAHCTNCHTGPTFTEAINPLVYINKSNKKTTNPILVARTVLGEQTDGFGVDMTLHDIGFANTSVVPDDYDVGLGGKDPFGNPLSFSDQYVNVLAKSAKTMLDPVKIRSCDFVDPFVKDFAAGKLITDPFASGACIGYKSLAKVPSQEAVKNEMAKRDSGLISTASVGSFKIPTLRNIELTGPYMHNGSMKSLEEVIEFYNRGGNAHNRRHFATLVFDQGFSAQQKADLVAFLKSLTDERVRFERAPFDHPQLLVSNGHGTNADKKNPRQLVDEFLTIPAVGKNGRDASLGAIKPFEEYLKP